MDRNRESMTSVYQKLGQFDRKLALQNKISKPKGCPHTLIWINAEFQFSNKTIALFCFSVFNVITYSITIIYSVLVCWCIKSRWAKKWSQVMIVMMLRALRNLFCGEIQVSKIHSKPSWMESLTLMSSLHLLVEVVYL